MEFSDKQRAYVMELQDKTILVVISFPVKMTSIFYLRGGGTNVLSVNSKSVSLNAGTKVPIASSS